MGMSFGVRRTCHITGGHSKESHKWSEVRADVIASIRRAHVSTVGGFTSDPAELADQLLKKVQSAQDDAEEPVNKLAADERLGQIADFFQNNRPSVLIQGQPAFAKCVQLFTKDILYIYIYTHVYI